MNYDRFYNNDLVNGVGLRLTLFVTGCQHGCEGCYNKSIWNSKSGKPFTKEVKEDILKKCENLTGLSLSGGDPFLKSNREDILDLCKSFKKMYPDKDIWAWTGFLLEDIKDLEVMKYIDVLIDGKFEKDNKTNLPWRGSDNQILHYLTHK